jgi:hypothetical protein
MTVSSVKTGAVGISFALDNNYMEPIATSLVGSGGVNQVTFNDIPQNYKHLQLRIIARSSISDTNDFVMAKFNGDNGSNYTYHYIRGDGSSANALGSGYGSSDYLRSVGFITGANATSGVFGVSVVDILDYTNTNKLKTIRTFTGKDSNSGNADGRVYLLSMLWGNANAITSINLITQGNIVQHSRFSLYGIKG